MIIQKNEQLFCSKCVNKIFWLWILFTQHEEKNQSLWTFLVIGCSEKFQAWQSFILVRKFQVVGLQLYLESAS